MLCRFILFPIYLEHVLFLCSVTYFVALLPIMDHSGCNNF